MRVWPATDLYRKHLKHPVAGGFRDHGSANWPDDQFTNRRIAEGSVLTHEPPSSSPSPSSPPPKAA